MKDENILEKANEKAVYFNKIINEKIGKYKYVGEIRSIGLINAIELVEDKKTKRPFDPKLRIEYEIYKKALKRGVLLRPIGGILYFNPPLTIEKPDMDFVVNESVESIMEVLGE